jgi:excisionase family DNA binding protein
MSTSGREGERQRESRGLPELGGEGSSRDAQHVLTVDEAAVLLRVSRNTAYEAVKRGEIPAVKIGRRLLIPRAALERLLEGVQSDD